MEGWDIVCGGVDGVLGEMVGQILWFSYFFFRIFIYFASFYNIYFS